jgi:hypothetical protein
MAMRATARILFLLLAAAAGCGGPKSRPDDEFLGGRYAGEAGSAGPRYYQATGGSPVFGIEPGQPALAGRMAAPASSIPPAIVASLFSDDVERIDGEITIEAIDRVGEEAALVSGDTGKRGDSASVKGWFRRSDSIRYEFSLERVAPARPGDPERTHFGGVGTNVELDGDSGAGIAVDPKKKVGVAIWGICALKREGQTVGEFPIRVTVGSRTRSAESGKYLGDLDATAREVDQVDLLIVTSRPVPSAERTLPAGQPRLPDITQIPGFHVVWGHAHVKFRP